MGKDYIVFNYTDGVIASPPDTTYATKQKAEEFIETFKQRFAKQGYYFTSNMERINPEQVELRIIKVQDLSNAFSNATKEEG